MARSERAWGSRASTNTPGPRQKVISDRARVAILQSRIRGMPYYRLAIKTGFTPNELSRLLHGGLKMTPRDDPRMQALARELELGIDQLFDEPE